MKSVQDVHPHQLWPASLPGLLFLEEVEERDETSGGDGTKELEDKATLSQEEAENAEEERQRRETELEEASRSVQEAEEAIEASDSADKDEANRKLKEAMKEAIDDERAKAQAEADVEAAKAQAAADELEVKQKALELAEAELSSADEATKKDAQETVDTARDEVDTAEKTKTDAEKAKQNAQEALDTTTEELNQRESDLKETTKELGDAAEEMENDLKDEETKEQKKKYEQEGGDVDKNPMGDQGGLDVEDVKDGGDGFDLGDEEVEGGGEEGDGDDENKDGDDENKDGDDENKDGDDENKDGDDEDKDGDDDENKKKKWDPKMLAALLALLGALALGAGLANGLSGNHGCNAMPYQALRLRQALDLSKAETLISDTSSNVLGVFNFTETSNQCTGRVCAYCGYRRTIPSSSGMSKIGYHFLNTSHVAMPQYIRVDSTSPPVRVVTPIDYEPCQLEQALGCIYLDPQQCISPEYYPFCQLTTGNRCTNRPTLAGCQGCSPTLPNASSSPSPSSTGVPAAVCSAHDTDESSCNATRGCSWGPIPPWKCLNKNTCHVGPDPPEWLATPHLCKTGDDVNLEAVGIGFAGMAAGAALGPLGALAGGAASTGGGVLGGAIKDGGCPANCYMKEKSDSTDESEEITGCLVGNTSQQCNPPGACSTTGDACALTQQAIHTLRQLQYLCRNAYNDNQCNVATMEQQCLTFMDEKSCAAQAPNCVWTTHSRPQCHTLQTAAQCGAKDGCWWVTESIVKNLHLEPEKCQPHPSASPAPAAVCAQHGTQSDCDQTSGCLWQSLVGTSKHQQEEIAAPGSTGPPAQCHWDFTNNDTPHWLKPEDAFYGNMLPFPDPCQNATTEQDCRAVVRPGGSPAPSDKPTCTWTPPIATAPPDTCPKQNNAQACSAISGCQWSDSGFHASSSVTRSPGGRALGVEGVCQEFRGTCAYSGTDAESLISPVMSSEGCFRSGGKWLPPSTVSPDLVTPPPQGFGWTCVDQKYNEIGEKKGDPTLRPDLDWNECWADICNNGGEEGLPAPSAAAPQLTPQQLQTNASPCWKPVFFNPCKDCKALPAATAAMIASQDDPAPPAGPGQKMSRMLRRLFHGSTGIMAMVMILALALVALFMNRYHTLFWTLPSHSRTLDSMDRGVRHGLRRLRFRRRSREV